MPRRAVTVRILRRWLLSARLRVHRGFCRLIAVSAGHRLTSLTFTRSWLVLGLVVSRSRRSVPLLAGRAHVCRSCRLGQVISHAGRSTRAGIGFGGGAFEAGQHDVELGGGPADSSVRGGSWTMSGRSGRSDLAHWPASGPRPRPQPRPPSQPRQLTVHALN